MSRDGDFEVQIGIVALNGHPNSEGVLFSPLVSRRNPFEMAPRLGKGQYY